MQLIPLAEGARGSSFGACTVYGAIVPDVVTPRADSVTSRVASCALAVLVQAASSSHPSQVAGA